MIHQGFIKKMVTQCLTVSEDTNFPRVPSSAQRGDDTLEGQKMESHLPVEPIWNHGFLDKLPSSAKFSRAVQLEREKKEISIVGPGSSPWIHQ